MDRTFSSTSLTIIDLKIDLPDAARTVTSPGKREIFLLSDGATRSSSIIENTQGVECISTHDFSAIPPAVSVEGISAPAISPRRCFNALLITVYLCRCSGFSMDIVLDILQLSDGASEAICLLA